MNARRPTGARSLLTASATLVVGCGGAVVSGNLVAPPMYELCVTPTPDTATVTIDDQPLEEDGCNLVYEGLHTVAASAEGFVTATQDVEVLEDTVIDLVLEPVATP